ncbi:hypothetical protein CJ030_MR3G007088 [Morella rubra]|uniref:Uncharacterized protein n=1 Tax=Morella rubra TaxID=262757 RepID=A0A6A1W7I6_9ROSI|nr:hypothetical protein CJ030_MR3G007088 [Morella rubra]
MAGMNNAWRFYGAKALDLITAQPFERLFIADFYHIILHPEQSLEIPANQLGQFFILHSTSQSKTFTEDLVITARLGSISYLLLNPFG